MVGYLYICKFLFKNNLIWKFSCICSVTRNPLYFRWIKTGLKPFWKASYHRQLSIIRCNNSYLSLRNIDNKLIIRCMIFHHGSEPVLFQRILIGFESILEIFSIYPFWPSFYVCLFFIIFCDIVLFNYFWILVEKFTSYFKI